jgi:vacuolar-type H+-ATPase subunit E/Vma4
MKEEDCKTKVRNAEEICAGIKEEADSQASLILQKAREEAKILNESKQEARRIMDKTLEEFGKELEKSRERINSTINLEKKRIILEEKDGYASRVLEEVKKKAGEFRSSKDYEDFLKDTILEGVLVVDSEKADVFYSVLDEKTVNENFRKKLESLCSEKLKKKVLLNFQKKDFRDTGVIVQSGDGSLVFDNRFLSRLERIYDDIYMKLLKEAF